MFPWVYGFEWTPGHVIFVGIFLTVVAVVAFTLAAAAFRSIQDYRQGKAGQIMWQAQFHDLPPADRACRHAMTGEFEGRVCDRGFDCRECNMHAKLAQDHAGGRLFHRGHTWVEPAPDGTVLIGLDEIASKLIGPAGRVEAPAGGSLLEANTPAFRIHKKGTEFNILAPVDGVLVETNPSARGWLARVKPPENASFAHLLSGQEAAAWADLELERLQLAAGRVQGLPSLADGGVLADDLSAILPGRMWESVCGEILLDI